jgi:hypothetical protein
MPTVGSPEPAPWGENCDNRVEKTPCLINLQPPSPGPCVCAHEHRIRDGRSVARCREPASHPRSARSVTARAMLPAGGNGRCHHARFVRGRSCGRAESACPEWPACLPATRARTQSYRPLTGNRGIFIRTEPVCALVSSGSRKLLRPTPTRRKHC